MVVSSFAIIGGLSVNVADLKKGFPARELLASS